MDTPTRRRTAAVLPGLVLLLGIGTVVPAVVGSPHPAGAQVLEQGVITEQGTQFVTEPEPPPKPAPPPEAPTPPQPPTPPQVRRPAPPPPAQEPPRYPNVAILLDTSDSMLNRAATGAGTLLDQAKAALKSVVNGMAEQTRVQVWTFNTQRRKLQMPRETSSGFVRVGARGSTARKDLIAAIDGVHTAGGTNLYKAIIDTLEIFGAREDQAAYRSGERFPVLVVISDGEDWRKTPHTLDSVLKARQRYPLVTVNTIGFHAGRNDRWFEDLCQIASHPEGCAPANDERQLQAILESFYQYKAPRS